MIEILNSIDSIYIGSLGATLILIAFVLGQLHVWNDTYFIYDLLNLVGSIFLVIYAWQGNSWPFLVLNSVWGIVSAKDVVTDFVRNSKKTDVSGVWEKWMK